MLSFAVLCLKTQEEDTDIITVANLAKQPTKSTPN